MKKFLKQILEKDARVDGSLPIPCFRTPLETRICTKPTLLQRKWAPNKFPPLPRAILAGLTVFLLLTVQVGPLWAAPETSREYTIKAGFVYNFTKFIQWPASVDASIESQGLQFCIAGKDRFGRALDGFAKALEENNKSLVIQKGVLPKSSTACHILFIDSSVSDQLEEYLKHVKGKPTLVVSDSPDFAERGVGINFVIRRNKTRFEINPYTVKESGIKISSELLKLAILVGKEEEK